jgi:hypothetical protein
MLSQFGQKLPERTPGAGNAGFSIVNSLRLELMSLIDSQRPPDYDINDWWQHEGGLINFQNEVIKYICYRLRY